MKKSLALFIIFAVCISFCACSESSNTSLDDTVIGKWVGEETDYRHTLHDNQLSSTKITIYFYEDMSFKEEVNNTLDGYQEYTGTWKYDGKYLTIYTKTMTKGTPKGSGYKFNSDGSPVEPIKQIIPLDHGYDKFAYVPVNVFHGVSSMKRAK